MRRLLAESDFEQFEIFMKLAPSAQGLTYIFFRKIHSDALGYQSGSEAGFETEELPRVYRYLERYR